MAWTTTASLCCRLVRLPSARRRPPSSTRCSAAQSPDAVDREFADLNLRPLYPNVRPPPFFFTSFFFSSPNSAPVSPPAYWCAQRGHHLRIRQHVNPLSSSFAVCPPKPNISGLQRKHELPSPSFLEFVFCCVRRIPWICRSGMRCSRTPCCPSWWTSAAVGKRFLSLSFICADILLEAAVLRECWCVGSGRFLIWLAKNSGERRNYLGLEIRQKVFVVLRFKHVYFRNR